MNSLTTIIVFFACIVVFEAIALYSVKRFSKSNETMFLIFSILSYAIIPLFFFKILKEGQGISTVNILWNVMSTVYGVLIGVLLFSEVIHGIQWIGIILGILSIFLIMWKSN